MAPKRIAKIKRKPEDFEVEEILSREFAGKIEREGGRFALYRMTKRNLDTDEAIERIAETLPVPRKSISFGGLKDRHAVAIQYLTVDLRTLETAKLPPKLDRKYFSIERIGTTSEAMHARSVYGNKFSITIRNLTRPLCAAMDHGRKFLSIPGSKGRAILFVNYYGEQRFGAVRGSKDFAARRLVEGNFEEALELVLCYVDRKASSRRKEIARKIAALWGNWRTLLKVLPDGPEKKVIQAICNKDYRSGFLALPSLVRQLIVESYQSYLWNEIALRFLRKYFSGSLREAHTAFGTLAFPIASSVPEELSKLEIPMPSPDMTFDAPWAETAIEVLSEEGIETRKLRIPGLESPFFGCAPRRLFAVAEKFSLGPLEKDETDADSRRFKRKLRFVLPRGAYATVLIDALFTK